MTDGDFLLTKRRLSRRHAFLLFVIFGCAPAVVLDTSCVKLPRRAQTAKVEAVSINAPPQGAGDELKRAPLVNINRASREELARLPGIGEGLAARIVEHRERYGAFRRAEHLLLVRGISERRFEQLRALVTVE
ncbi:MAG: ComEA family DNA-binding protein [Pyrinomonadaceae bacterium]